MLHQRRTLQYNPSFSLKLLHRCLRTKPSRVYDVVSKKKNREDGEEEEGQMRLFKSRGQHLLTNTRVLDSIVRTSEINSNDTVLEIGPGTGNLTLKLLEAAKKVVAVEIDKRMVEILRKRAAEKGLQDRLEIISGDALKTEFPGFDLVVANIPYNISSPLLAKLVFGAKANPFRSATLLLQKEFARRLLANPGDHEYNRLAVNVKLVADVKFVMDVSKRDFVPCPKVDSSVVKIYPKTDVPDVDLEEWWAFTRTCFSKKNKTLGAMFRQKRKLVELMKLSKDEGIVDDTSGKFHACDSGDDGDEESTSEEGSSELILGSNLFREKVISVLECGGFLDKRPSKLSNNDLLRLLSQFNREGIYFHDQARKGIPPSLRPKVWFSLSGAAAKKSTVPDTYYNDLTAAVEDKVTPATKQIDHDLPRTFPGHPWLDTPEGHAALRRVLVGYSFRDSDVGYCQGLNYVAALLLLVMKTEEEAFWMLAVLLENVLVSDCYTYNLSGCHIEQRVFKDLLTKKCPRVAAHLEALEFDVSLVCTEWFLCLFSKSLPSESTLRVWDVLFYEGAKVLFNVALAIFKVNEEELLVAHHVGDVINIIQRTTHHLFDPDELLTAAFDKIGFMTTTTISKQRKKQEPAVMAELDQRLRRLNSTHEDDKQ